MLTGLLVERDAGVCRACIAIITGDVLVGGRTAVRVAGVVRAVVKVVHVHRLVRTGAISRIVAGVRRTQVVVVTWLCRQVRLASTSGLVTVLRCAEGALTLYEQMDTRSVVGIADVLGAGVAVIASTLGLRNSALEAELALASDCVGRANEARILGRTVLDLVHAGTIKLEAEVLGCRIEVVAVDRGVVAGAGAAGVDRAWVEVLTRGLAIDALASGVVASVDGALAAIITVFRGVCAFAEDVSGVLLVTDVVGTSVPVVALEVELTLRGAVRDGLVEAGVITAFTDTIGLAGAAGAITICTAVGGLVLRIAEVLGARVPVITDDRGVEHATSRQSIALARAAGVALAFTVGILEAAHAALSLLVHAAKRVVTRVTGAAIGVIAVDLLGVVAAGDTVVVHDALRVLTSGALVAHDALLHAGVFLTGEVVDEGAADLVGAVSIVAIGLAWVVAALVIEAVRDVLAVDRGLHYLAARVAEGGGLVRLAFTVELVLGRDEAFAYEVLSSTRLTRVWIARVDRDVWPSRAICIGIRSCIRVGRRGAIRIRISYSVGARSRVTIRDGVGIRCARIRVWVDDPIRADSIRQGRRISVGSNDVPVPGVVIDIWLADVGDRSSRWLIRAATCSQARAQSQNCDQEKCSANTVATQRH
jgi:hypothetical protein